MTYVDFYSEDQLNSKIVLPDPLVHCYPIDELASISGVLIESDVEDLLP